MGSGQSVCHACSCSPSKENLPYPVYEAAKKGHPTIVTRYLNQSGDVNATHYGETLLHAACTDGRENVLSILLNEKQLCVNLRNGRNETALMLAAQNGYEDCVKVLLEFKHRCPIEIHNKNNYGQSALDIAHVKNHQDVAYCMSSFLRNTPPPYEAKPRWANCCGHLIKLGMQAALEAKRGGHEHVQHTLTLHHKELEVVWHLLTTETWRLHLLPLLLDRCQDTTPISSLPFIMVLHSEVAALGLIETLVFNEESAAALEGLVLDVIDYTVRQLVRLATHTHTYPNQPLYGPGETFDSFSTSQENNDKAGHSSKEKDTDFGENKADDHQKNLKSTRIAEKREENMYQEVSREERRARLVLGAKAVAVLHLLAGCRKHLPLCATTRLMSTHDVPQLLATLVYMLPWKAHHKNVAYVFEDSEWRERTAQDPPLSRIECQIWATLQTLLFDPDCITMYEINSARRNVLLKLRGHLNEAALSQVPSLAHIARWFATLAITIPQQAQPPPLITTLPQLSEGVAGMWDGRWEELSQRLASKFLTPTPKCLHALASTMAAAWDLDALEELLPHPPLCAICGSPAGQRCSQCHNQWYCHRKCQVKDWPQHKQLCELIANCHSKTGCIQESSTSPKK